jgi:NADP-dependent 3-hydroxy acid dehydrogenase YdfG
MFNSNKSLIKNPTLKTQKLFFNHKVSKYSFKEKVKDFKVYFEEKYDKLDVLLNNAGVTTLVPHDDFEGLTNEWIDRIIQTNFRGLQW